MPLTQTQIEHVQHWQDHQFPGGMRCPMCGGSTRLAIGERQAMFVTEADDPADSHPGFPVIPITCGTCGYVMLFDAKPMGLS